MASHRKPRQRPFAGGTVRRAATIALAGAATAATALDGTGHAAPGLTPAEVKARVDRYHRQAEEVTERYNGARADAEAARTAYEELQDEAARKTARLNASRNALGSYATAQYRSGAVAPDLQLALSSSPEDYLDRASLADRAGSRQGAAVARLMRQIRGLKQVRAEASGRLRELNRSREALARHKRTVEEKLDAAEELLDRLTAKQRARALAEPGGGTAVDGGSGAADGDGRGGHRPHADRGTARGTRAPAAPPTGRAALAVSYAYGALGKPYVWGATGPSGYDCSGLTQAAWRAAGVGLPRTTYTQINTGARVPRSELAPGDLVFFYSGVSHVGLYVGGGKMIHAPRPGAPVRIASIDEMPFAGAARPT
ncbi:C40 family peptidase [Streptomyces sp. XD-27]|uniref:C40 family peptidase n=1 Tax=Streptomyces sp. XD-27 TaxID=3062779 RepID=UPI0026F46201|nr:C40 family peptidase [Streptomyces sp. XD-27]WKX70896.1 NlpC/P60 family protein [Streptomyces sp. XD-27]